MMPTMGRNKIVLDDNLVELAKELTGIKNTEDVVRHALKDVVRRASKRELRSLRGQVDWIGDLDEMRRARLF